MVEIIQEWDVLEEYTGEKLGFYQVLEIDDKYEIRVQTGKVGFRKQFKKTDVDELNKITAFCEKRHFIKVIQHLRDEDFFK